MRCWPVTRIDVTVPGYPVVHFRVTWRSVKCGLCGEVVKLPMSTSRMMAGNVAMAHAAKHRQ